ncbi:MAG: methyltransferase [Nitrospirae bacterium]|nr:methyltransferase [Nitrospirota bacterium]
MQISRWATFLLNSGRAEIQSHLKNAIIRRLRPLPVRARSFQTSACFSADDDISGPSDDLLTLGIEAAQRAKGIRLDELAGRRGALPYLNTWPGEHYRLLAAIVQILKPKLAIEIGTFTGLSALAMKAFLPLESTLATFDTVDWSSHPEYVLQEDDFMGGRLIRHMDDVSDPAVFPKYRDLFARAQLIFVDAAKDGVMEYKLWNNLQTLKPAGACLLIFDDIRLWSMLRFWRQIPLPRLDLTSFGHWTGTGLVEVRGRYQPLASLPH